MVDLVITASQVLPDAEGDSTVGLAGATLTAGQSVYLDSTTNTYKLADANAVLTAAAIGITLHAALAGQPIKVARGGSPTLGASAAPAVGMVYVVSATAGGIAPITDLTSLMYTTILGVGAASSKIKLNVFVSGQLFP